MENSMKNLSAVGALALTMGLTTAIPAHADAYYTKDGYYGPTHRYDNDYGYYHRGEMLTQWEMVRDIERQGYYGISDLHPNSFSNSWEAIAYVNGTMVRVTVDPYSGRVLYANAI
jgi:hypothetical protein